MNMEIENWDVIREMAREIFKDLKSEEIQEIKERIIHGDFPRTWAEMEKANLYKDYIGVGLFFGLVSAPRRHSNRLAESDVLTSADYFNVKLPQKITDLSGLVMAEVWEKILTSL